MPNRLDKISNGTKNPEVNPVRNIEYTRIEKISNGVKITIKNFQKKILISPKRIEQTILKVLSAEGINPVRKNFSKGSELSNGVKKSGEITICFLNDKKIKELNKRYLEKNTPTDVLVFDMSEKKDSSSYFADIVISTDTAVCNAKIFKTSPLYELYLYVIHGLLHLLGYQDKTLKQKIIMQKKAEKLLKSQLTTNPICPFIKRKP